MLALGETVEEAFHFVYNVQYACEIQVRRSPEPQSDILFPALTRTLQLPPPLPRHCMVTLELVFMDSCVSLLGFSDVVSLRVTGTSNLPIDCPEKKTLIHLAKPSLINKSPQPCLSWRASYPAALRKLSTD